MKRKLALIASLAVAAVIIPAAASSASGGDHHGWPYEEVAGGLVSPLHLAVGTGKSLYVTQDFAATLSRIGRDGDVEDIYAKGVEGWDVAGVETRGATTFFLESTGAGLGDPAKLEGYLKAVGPGGDVRTIADLAEYERKYNPDGNQKYGFAPGTSAACLAETTPPEGEGGPPPQYKGVVDSHPYATAVQGNTAYVADAGMNAILRVNIRTGEISTLAVLPPRPFTIPAEAAEELMAPSCAGFTYAFEFVPTDVEIGPDGWLYVTSLPGGPESEALGHRGAIFKVNPWTGATRLWVDYILSPTGLAVANTGDVYVASLFGNEILKFHAWKGHRTQFLKVNQPADVEIQGRTLYATIDALPGPPAGPGAAPPAGPPAGKVIKADIR